MRQTSRFVAFAAFLFLGYASAAAETIRILVRHDGKPLKGLHVTAWDSEAGEYVSAVSDEQGVATFVTNEPLDPYDFQTDCADSASCDFVLRNNRMRRGRFLADAVLSYGWKVRTQPRICDEWARALDIPRGYLYEESAEEYDRWYASLAPQAISNCELLSRMAEEMGSPAPWFFYEFKAMPPSCEGGRQVAEIDWTGWYRRLLEEATGAQPGLCLADWERWWASKGYPPIPDQKELRKKR